MEQDNCTAKDVVVDKHIAQWHSKALHGQWPKVLLERSVQSSAWLRKAYLNPVMEALIKMGLYVLTG